MACTTPNCSQTQPAGSAIYQAPIPVGLPVQQCAGWGFCNDGLLGLPYTPGIDLVGVSPGDKCLSRLSAHKGYWKHDPARSQGADHVGPLDDLDFTPSEKFGSGDAAGFGSLLLAKDVLDSDGRPIGIRVLAQDVAGIESGTLGVINECGGKYRHDRLIPAAVDPENKCFSNLHLLGFVKEVISCGGMEFIQYLWKELTELVFPDSQLEKFTDVDLTEGTAWRKFGAKKVGNCWQIGLLPAEEAPDESGCAGLEASGNEFDALIVCDAGVEKKLLPQAGQVLVGTGSKWNLVPGVINLLPSGIHTVAAKLAGTGITQTQDMPIATMGSAAGTFAVSSIGIPDRATHVWVRGLAIYDIGSTAAQVNAWVKCNSLLLTEVYGNNYGEVSDKSAERTWVKLTAGSFTYEIAASASSASGSAFARLDILGWI